MKVSIVVDGQETNFMRQRSSWDYDWSKILNFYKCAWGEVAKAYYCTPDIHPYTTENDAKRTKRFWQYMDSIGWSVQIVERKPNGEANVDAKVGYCLAECFSESDAIILFAGDNDYFSCLQPYIRAAKPIFCVNHPVYISKIFMGLQT